MLDCSIRTVLLWSPCLSSDSFSTVTRTGAWKNSSFLRDSTEVGCTGGSHIRWLLFPTAKSACAGLWKEQCPYPQDESEWWVLALLCLIFMRRLCLVPCVFGQGTMTGHTGLRVPVLSKLWIFCACVSASIWCVGLQRFKCSWRQDDLGSKP